MPKISVIMSVYNTQEEWLRESIESILNQTFSDFEFIIINDGYVYIIVHISTGVYTITITITRNEQKCSNYISC